MRIGLILGLHGRAEQAPRWIDIRDQAQLAEQIGFDLVVIEDALLYLDEDGSVGYWESVSMAGALSAVTSTIAIGHSVINAPYRSAALTAKVAETLSELSGGRYFLGIGLGNTMDYEQFGIQADRRFSRFAETIEIIHRLLRTGRVVFDGAHQSARGAELVLRGPRPAGPPVVVAARGPQMLRLAARFSDGWNWWTSGDPDFDELRRLLRDVDRACEREGRDPATLARSLDVYSLDPLEVSPQAPGTIAGTVDALAERLLAFGELGFTEVRCNLAATNDSTTQRGAVEAMRPVVERLHAVHSERDLVVHGGA